MTTPDRVFDEPRLADVYDALDPDRSDLDVYVALVDELGARTVVDIGCGTGTLACMLAARGLDVVGVDPAAAMLAVAARKDHADRVRWVHGVARDAVPLNADVALMTANVAQVFLADDEWLDTLRAVHALLRPGGRLVFETRRPERAAWRDWNRAASYSETDIPGVGVVASWYDVVAVDLPFVTFHGTIRFASDGAELVSESTLRFRSEDELVASLTATGFSVDEIRDTPDRPGKELVFIATVGAA